ncbi:uncharacterized protein LOC111385473 [Olea europaea var. sylvestris]|uniref:uncharacterized protein LOC111385473 n=1 Tax=Olea europaea var. sylvestris TaxID=158386 RepID=UPI000C1CF369|nr:uncharacterized protein LOC111385473 [Olea europaea var. sylvestris]
MADGSEYVVHMVTDNAANYVAAGRLLEREFQTLFWSPCAAHCINLMFHDIGKLDEVSNVVSQASKITKYIYNHCYPLHLMRKFTGRREIHRLAPTRFATNFIALQSILAQKDPLRAMCFGKSVLLLCNLLSTIVQLTEPLVRVLRIVDSDEKPSMGYLYEAIHVAKSEMERRFQRMKNRVAPYLQIIQNRWDSQLRKNLHATRQAHGDFGRLSAVADRHRMAPDEWWTCYGCSAPNVQTLAIRVLSQTCSSSSCKRN